MKNIAIITSGFLPVPATKGGAVENLIVNLLNENEKNKKIKFEIFSIYDQDALNKSKKYENSNFRFIKVNHFIKNIDKMVFFLAKNIFKKQNSQSYRYIFQRLYYLNECSKLLKKYNYDMVILENHPSQYLALKWRKNYLKYLGKYYYHCHNEFPSTYGCEKIIKNTKRIICVSEFIARNVSKDNEIPIDKFVVLRNCIDAKRFSGKISNEEKESIKKKYGIAPNDKILIFTGRITPEKGVKELIESLKYVKYKNYKLLVLGSALNELKTKTKYQEQIEDEVKKISDKVIFTGFIKYDEINTYYALADIAVLPSIWNDPAPLTIIESLMSGLPIITTNSGGIPEYATDGSAIILQNNEKIVQNLSENIDYLLNNTKELKRMREKAIEVSKNLTLENYYFNFINIIRDDK